jgi:glucose/mannose-6-phosphate isomerase
MTDLDNLQAIKELDKENVLASVDVLPKQCLHAWEDNEKLEVPNSYRDINRIIMCGMGGSGLGARVIESVFASTLKYPFVRVNDYDLPAYTDEKTLVICSSFSGTTEETVQNAHQAQNYKSKWMAIGTGGALIDFAKEHKAPYYQIIPTYNPSKQPRMALGYSVIGQLALASKVGLVNITKQDIESLVKEMETAVAVTNVNIPVEKNPAKTMANKFYGKKVIFVAARHLLASAHVVKNQMNENAKNFSAIFDIPELNHHLMEGLRFPESNREDLLFIFINSNLYPERIQQRFNITQNIVKENNIQYVTWEAKASDLLSQAFELIQFGSYANFYLSMLNGINPAPIPYVDKFKTDLGQPLGQWK